MFKISLFLEGDNFFFFFCNFDDMWLSECARKSKPNFAFSLITFV